MDFNFESDFNRRYGTITRRILGMLSENSRVPITEMASTLKISRKSVARRLRAMGRELGLRYVLHLNHSALGFNTPHLIYARFGKKPDFDKIAETLKQSYIPQLAFTLDENAMVVYANAISRSDYVLWDRRIRRALGNKFAMQWYPSEMIFRRIGFFPLSNSALELAKIPQKYKDMLKILNENSRMQFTELAERLGINYKTAVYHFNELAKMRYIRKFTYIMEPPDDAYLIGAFGKYIMAEDYRLAARLTREMFVSDDSNPLIGRYLLRTSLIGAHDSFFIGAFDNRTAAKSHCIDAYRKTFEKFAPVHLTWGGINRVLVGKLPVSSINLKMEYRENKAGAVS